MLDQARDHDRHHDHDGALTDANLTTGGATYPVLIEPGVYEANSLAVQHRKLWGAPRVILTVEIKGGRHDGTRLPWFATALPRTGRIPASSKLWRAICLTLGRRPTRHDEPSVRLLLHHLYRIRVETVTTDHQGRALPPGASYSVVRHLEARLA
jgi:hypothetical protein